MARGAGGQGLGAKLGDGPAAVFGDGLANLGGGNSASAKSAAAKKSGGAEFTYAAREDMWRWLKVLQQRPLDDWEDATVWVSEVLVAFKANGLLKEFVPTVEAAWAKNKSTSESYEAAVKRIKLILATAENVLEHRTPAALGSPVDYQIREAVDRSLFSRYQVIAALIVVLLGGGAVYGFRVEGLVKDTENAAATAKADIARQTSGLEAQIAETNTQLATLTRQMQADGLMATKIADAGQKNAQAAVLESRVAELIAAENQKVLRERDDLNRMITIDKTVAPAVPWEDKILVIPVIAMVFSLAAIICSVITMRIGRSG